MMLVEKSVCAVGGSVLNIYQLSSINILERRSLASPKRISAINVGKQMILELIAGAKEAFLDGMLALVAACVAIILRL